MLKLIEIGTEEFGEPSIKVIDDWSGHGLVKAAADSRISNFVSNLIPEPDKVYLHILAMGAGEFYGSNRNADYFPENNLIDYHKTFETSPAHVFRNHINKNPEIALGKVICAVYNERMHRVELVVWIDKEKGYDVVQRLERGEFPATSMACKTPYDVCSICGNKAHTRQEYCDHLTGQLGRIYPDGRKVMAYNTAPLKFFDISIVVRPADVTSSILQKVASEEAVSGSAELAEVEGLTEKVAAHKKLSELVKEIEEGNVVDYSDSLNEILAKVKDPHEAAIPALAHHDLGDVFSTMAHLGISPSLGYLAEIIGHKLVGHEAKGIGDLVEGFVGKKGVNELLLGDKSFGDFKDPNPYVIDILMPSVKQASLLAPVVIGRSSQPYIDIPYDGLIQATNVGYTGSGPYVEETPVEKFNRLYGHPDSHKPGGLLHMIKTLIAIGGAALAAKWYITNAIEKKFQEQQANYNNGVKIVLVKHASEYRSTYHLAKCEMIRILNKKA